MMSQLDHPLKRTSERIEIVGTLAALKQSNKFHNPFTKFSIIYASNFNFGSINSWFAVIIR